MVLSPSPYLLTSHGKIASQVIKSLFISGHQVAGLVWNHDITYFLPEEENGKKKYYYEFEDWKIPIIPFDRIKEPEVAVYEHINKLQPDMIISVGDHNDFLYMKAVKMFSDEIKWLAILTNYSYPINENDSEIISNFMDGILCTSQRSFDELSCLVSDDILLYSPVGVDAKDDVDLIPRDVNKFRIMTCGKNAQIDNIPMLMEAVGNIRSEIPEVELYVHSNVYDKGDYDFNLLKSRFDPGDDFIVFPSKYVSLFDGYSDKDFHTELAKSDIFASISMMSSTGLSVYEAMNYGCFPLMSDVGCHKDIAKSLDGLFIGSSMQDFIIPGSEVMTTGEIYLNICNPASLQEKLIRVYERMNKKEGNKEIFRENVQRRYHQRGFFGKLSELIGIVISSKSTICVETV